MTLQADLNTVTAKLDADATTITALLNQPPSGPSTATYTLPSGYAVTIDSNGISSVTNQGGQVAAGLLQMVWGKWSYQAYSSAGFKLTIIQKSCSNTATGATVVHDYTGSVNAHVVYTYVINGNVIDISALVVNTGSSDIPITAFASPRFLFDSWSTAKASSNQLGWDQSHSQNSAANFNIILSYPSSNVPLAATYVKTLAGSGKPINFCTWSSGSPFDWFMTMGNTLYPNPGTCLSNFFFKNVPVGGSQVFKFSYLFSDSTDPFVLLQPYKDFLRSKLPVQYNPDARPWTSFTSINTSSIRPDNPYGYNDAGTNLIRRFDKLTGCQDYITKLVGPLTTNGYQGIILWQPQGINPRGVQYRPDFNVWPSVSVPNIPVLFGGFTSAGLRLGLQARPSVTVTSATWDTDTLTGLNDLKYSWDDLSVRLKWATDRGVTAFYLDSFVNSQTDHAVLQKMRTQLGSEVQLFTEGTTILSLPLAGVYLPFTYTNGSYVFYKNYAAFKFIYPEANYFAIFGGTLPPGGYQALYTYMFQNKLSPVVEDYRVYNNLNNENAIIKALVPQYIDSNNHWI